MKKIGVVRFNYSPLSQFKAEEKRAGSEILLSLFASGFNIVFTAKTPKIKIVKDDPGDDKFIECAVALKARAVITGDKALEGLGEYVGIKILTPQKFLEKF